MSGLFRCAGRAAAAFGIVLCAFPVALGAEETAGQAILTEASAWRRHVTWGPFVQQAGNSLKAPRLYRQLQFSTEAPAQDWVKTEFDDGAWGLWREPHVARTFDGSSVPLYDTQQYGMQQPCVLRRLCLRGRFEVADPAGVRGLRLTVVCRGGVAAYLNGQEVGRKHLSREAEADPLGLAEVYPKEVYTDLEGKPWGLKNGNIDTIVFKDSAALERFNLRMRELAVEVPVSALRKGTNVLALDLRAAPAREDVNANEAHEWWSACGVARVELRGGGAVAPAVERPAGVQVWATSSLFRANPFGSVRGAGIGQGTRVILYDYPLCWTESGERTGSIRMVGARNGWFTGQVVVSSGSAIRGLKAAAGDLVHSGGGGRIPAAECRVGYMTFPPEPPAVMTDPAVSMLDVLYETPPAEIPALAATPAGHSDSRDRGGVAWCDGGATAPVWLRVRVPKDAPEGEYTGTLTVSAEGLKPTAVPVRLKVHGYTLPDPRDFTAQVGLMHSPDSLALKYKVPLWSDRHFELMDRTCSYMGELGGSVVFIPLVTGAWLGNRQTMVGWGQAGGQADFKVFDRYLDMVQKHMKPRAVCLYVCHGHRDTEAPAVTASSGSVPVPAYAPTPEAVAFWKPVVTEALERLKRRGLDRRVTLGLTIETGRYYGDMQPVADLFKEVWPEGRWADLAHYGARGGKIGGVPYGLTMSVYGNSTPFRSKKWGQPDLPLVVLKHFRADPVIDLRPVAPRGALYWAAERAMSEAQGVGPLGMDFWNFPAGEVGGKRSGPVEKVVISLTMHGYSAAALLAPGPEGPLPTARFEIFRQGLQVCEARTVIEKARENGRLSGDLAKRCDEVLKRRADTYELLRCAGAFAQGEGWRWFENYGWEELTGELFEVAGEVAKASGQ